MHVPQATQCTLTEGLVNFARKYVNNGGFINLDAMVNCTTSCKINGDTLSSWGVINLPIMSHTSGPLLLINIRELKQRQRRRQRERHKFAYLVDKNNSFARPARAFFTFVHFVAVVSKTTT